VTQAEISTIALITLPSAFLTQCDIPGVIFTAEVVAAWCSCMNNKMSSNETLSITAWEKTHPKEVAACDKEAGWK
jgi:hypothetical protein